MTQETSKSRSIKLSQDQLQLLSEEIMERIEDIFEMFDVKYKKSNKKYYGCCPIHVGDKDNAWNMFHDGNSYRGNWKCRTQGCDSVFKGSPIGFVRGLLSRNKNNWESHADKDKVYSFSNTLRFLLDFIGSSVDNLKVDLQEVEKRRFTSQINLFGKTRTACKTPITREIIRSRLSIPAQYFVDREYSAELLDKYDIGLCTTTGKEMHNRVVVPIYDDNHKYLVGCSGRSVNKECTECKCYHPEGVHVDKEHRYWWPKWKHSTGFNAEDYLYNYWNAKETIKNSGVAIIVEGPADVWRLEQNQIHNSVAIFGSSMSENQKSILDKSGAMSLIILTDTDLAGKIAAQNILTMCNKTYRLYFPKITSKDVGEMSCDEITNDIKPIMTSITKALGL